MSAGSTRGSTQPIIIVFIDGMIFSFAEKRLSAKTSLRWVKGSYGTTVSEMVANHRVIGLLTEQRFVLQMFYQLRKGDIIASGSLIVWLGQVVTHGGVTALAFSERSAEDHVAIPFISGMRWLLIMVQPAEYPGGTFEFEELRLYPFCGAHGGGTSIQAAVGGPAGEASRRTDGFVQSPRLLGAFSNSQ
jgi:hypothetical protein